MTRSFTALLLFLAIVSAVAGGFVAVSTTDKDAVRQSRNAIGGQNSGSFDREAMTRFRDDHKFTTMLTRLVRNIGRLEQEQREPLTPEQAQAMLAILQPLSAQPTMTQDDAEEVYRALQRALTMEQRTMIAKMSEAQSSNGSGFRGGSGGGGGRGSGGRSQGGQRFSFDPAAMKNYNPFYTASDNPMVQRYSEQMNAVIATLANKVQTR